MSNSTQLENKRRPSWLRLSLMVGTGLSMMATSTAVMAQDNPEDEIIVTGIRASLENALIEKRNADSLIEVIRAEDIGKLPDQNLAEVLENITGIQITRTAGVGTGVQIRGSNSNRVEINGISSVGSGAGRNGISFEDINPAIISSVEVIKAPEAKTIEGSVGGTVNLKTIQPLDLKKPLLNVRVQAEDSSLSVESIKPRISGALGNRWDTGGGEIGVVITGSYTEQEAVSFRPRVDRDNLTINSAVGPTAYQGVQFLVQEQENDDYETYNIASTVEWAPNEELKLSASAIINNQERSRDQYRLQASGISGLRTRPENAPTEFETLDYTAIGGPILEGALVGIIEPGPTNHDGNLRFSSETASRVTDSQIFSLGGEWTRGNWDVSAELATSSSDTSTPTFNTTVNFINPNCINVDSRNDNCTPFRYDLRNDQIQWGINFDSPTAPSVADLTNPANVMLDQVDVGRNTTDNTESAARLDVAYDFADTKFGDYLTSVEAGVRFNKSTHEFIDIDDRIGGFSQAEDAPNGSLFADILVTGPSNFGDADGRSLFISDFLLVDPDRSFSDPDAVLASLEAALAAHRVLNPQADGDLTLQLSEDLNAYRDISEKTTALYGQANFASGIFRGNLGLRYISTDVDSTGYGPSINGAARQLETTSGSYSFFLPRFNLVATPSDEVVLRLGYGKDIRRPGFNSLATGFTLDNQENSAVRLGNPGLEPEEVTSFDVSADWYFAPSAVFSVGYFTKDRTNIFGQNFEGAALVADVNDVNGLNGTSDLVREPGPNCSSGVYNPTVQPNVLGDPNSLGLCVDFTQPGNDPAVTTQSGVEFALQYDLSSFEDRLGWASGFGAAGNLTLQKFSGGTVVDTTSGRGLTVLGPLSVPRGLLDFSKTAYNITGYYEKYGLQARARYTWRSSFRTNDFGGGANTSGSSTLSFPVHTLARGQLNASINYDITDNFNIGVEATNLTKAGIIQKCATKEGPTCFVGLPDRRIIFGGSYTF